MRRIAVLGLSIFLFSSSSALASPIPRLADLYWLTNHASQPAIAQQQAQQTVITLQRTACFGFCPIYKLTIYGDGRVVYEGERFVKETGTRTTKISRAAVRQLVKEFKQVNYFTLSDSYTGGHTDAPSAITSLTLGKQQKTVNHYMAAPDAPETLKALEDKIDQVVNSQQWIGTDEERRPQNVK